MQKSKLNELESTVEELLRTDKLTREDDCYLIFKVIEKKFPLEIGKRFSDVMFGAKEKGISFEGITRCRRKVQSKHPELKNQEISKIRNNEQQQYKEYSKE